MSKPNLYEQKYASETLDNNGNPIVDPYLTQDEYRSVISEDFAKQQAHINSAIERKNQSIAVSKETKPGKNTIKGSVAKGFGGFFGGIAKVNDAINRLPLPIKGLAIVGGGAVAVATAPVTGTAGLVFAGVSGAVTAGSFVFSNSIAKAGETAGNTVTNVTGNKSLGTVTRVGVNLLPAVFSMGLSSSGTAMSVTKAAKSAITEGAFVAGDDIVRAGAGAITNYADDIARSTSSVAGTMAKESGKEFIKETATQTGNIAKNASQLFKPLSPDLINKSTNEILKSSDDIAKTFGQIASTTADDVVKAGANKVLDATSGIVKECDTIVNASNIGKSVVRTGVNASDDALKMFNEFGLKKIPNFKIADNIDDAITMAKDYAKSNVFRPDGVKGTFVNYGDDIVKSLERAKTGVEQVTNPVGSNLMNQIKTAQIEMFKGTMRKIPIVSHFTKRMHAFAPQSVSVLNNNIKLGRMFNLLGDSSIFSQYAKLGKLNALFPTSTTVNSISKVLGTIAKPLGDNVNMGKILVSNADHMGKLGSVLKGVSSGLKIGAVVAPNLGVITDGLYGFSEQERMKLHEVMTDKRYTPELREQYLTQIFKDPTKLIVPTSLGEKYGFENYVYTDDHGFVDMVNRREVNTETLFKEVYGDKYSFSDIEMDLNNVFKDVPVKPDNVKRNNTDVNNDYMNESNDVLMSVPEEETVAEDKSNSSTFEIPSFNEWYDSISNDLDR